jgi:hypothetical protein
MRASLGNRREDIPATGVREEHTAAHHTDNPQTRPLPLSVRVRLQLRRELTHALLHDFAGLEFYRRARRDDEAAPRLIRVPADARPGEFHLEDTEIAQLDTVPASESFDDLIERLLNDLEYLMLNKPCVVADVKNDFPFRQCSHGKCP